MKNRSFLFFPFICILVFASCKKEDSPTLDPSTSFTLNGVHYTPQDMLYFDYGGGLIEYSDSAISDDGNSFLRLVMLFNISTSTPATGNYGIFTDSLSLVTPGNVELDVYEFTRSNKTLNSYKIISPGSGTAAVTNISDKISLKLVTQTLSGIPFDTVTGTSNGPNFICNLSAVTLTEQ